MSDHWNTTPHYRIDQEHDVETHTYLVDIETDQIVCEIHDMATFQELLAAPDDVIWEFK